MIKKIIVGSLFISLVGLGIFYAIDYKLKTDTRLSELTNTIAVQSETINENVASLEELREQKIIVEEERDDALATLETRTQERDAEIALKNAVLEEKALLSATLETRTQERDAEIALKNQALEEKATALAELIRLNGVITSINEELAELESELADELLANSQNQELISSLQADIVALNVLKAGLQSDISILNGQISTLEGQITEYENTIFGLNGQIFLLNEQIITLGEQITTRENTISEKNIEIEELNGQIAFYETQILTFISKIDSAENLIRFLTFEHDSSSFVNIEENILNLQSLNELFSIVEVYNVKYEISLNSTVLQVNSSTFDLTNYLVEGLNEILIKPYLTYNSINYFDSTVIKTVEYTAPVVPEYISMSVAEALSAENGTLIEVTGVVTGKYSSLTTSTRYNTLYLADETGEIVIYEINSNWEDVQIGDVIVAHGDKTVYSGLHEIQHASITTVEENITSIDRISVSSVAELTAKIPQRVALTATVSSFTNATGFEVILSFDGITINARLSDSSVLASVFEIGKTYEINAHMHTSSVTKTFLIIQSVDDIVEVPSLEQLIVPTPLEVNLATQELIIPTVANATGYRVVLNNSITETVDATATTFDLSSYNLENNSVIELFALGDGVTYADSEGVQYVLEYLQFQPLTLSIEGTVVTISNIDSVALSFNNVFIEGTCADYYFCEPLNNFVNNQYDFRNKILLHNQNLERDSTYNINLRIQGFMYYNSSINSSVSFIYDFYPEVTKLLTPIISNYNPVTRELTVNAYRDFDILNPVQYVKIKFFIQNESGLNPLSMANDGRINFNEDESTATGIFKLYSQSPYAKDDYQIAIMSTNLNFENSDLSISNEYYELEFKETIVPELIKTDNILSWETNQNFTYIITIFYRGTNNQVFYEYLDSGVDTFDLVQLELESGFYDIALTVFTNELGKENGYAQYSSMTNKIEFNIN